MISRYGKRTFIVLVCATVFLGSSCISNEGHRRAMASREQRILGLQDERAQLKRELEDADELIEALQLQLSEANARAAATPQVIEKPVVTPAASRSFPELDALGIDYGMRNGRMVISIPSSITFPSGKAALSNEGKSALRKVASTLGSQYSGKKYQIEGHTDSDPISKSKFASNRALSIARAMAVLTYLVEECSVSDDQCIVVGHGQYQNVAPNNSSKNKAKNRRVEIVVQN